MARAVFQQLNSFDFADVAAEVGTEERGDDIHDEFKETGDQFGLGSIGNFPATDNDSTYILDRFRHLAEVIQITGKSFRLHHADNAAAEPLLLAGEQDLAKLESTIPAEDRVRFRKESVQRLIDLFRATKRDREIARWEERLRASKSPDTSAESKVKGCCGNPGWIGSHFHF